MTASLETARMLASILGVEEEEATTRLARTVLITVHPGKAGWGAEIEAMVGRTISAVREPNGAVDLEVVVGGAQTVSSARTIFANIGADRAVAGSTQIECPVGSASPLFEAATAPVVAALVVRTAIGDSRLPPSPDPLELRLKDFGIPELAEDDFVSLDGAALVGAGAVAHGFQRALRRVPVRGSLDIIDPKLVGAGNLNRCLYLQPGDEGGEKARLLAERAAGDFPELLLNPIEAEFAAYAKGREPVSTMIVTVDSRLARRKLQKFLPGRIVDASTTDVREVVVHSNRQPTEGACLACLYRHTPNEHARETSIAEGLGLDIETVRQGFVTPQAAAQIVERYPDLDAAPLINKAFDSLFRELCATKALTTHEGRQVLTPFAFVSGLAGALLAIELVRQHAGLPDTGGWHVDPWRGPVGRTRRPTSKSLSCEVCSDPHFGAASRALWAR